MTSEVIATFAHRLASFRSEASTLLGSIESSPTRGVTLDESYHTLDGLNLKQDDLFRQALRCVEVKVFRAAHVMAWAALVDCLQQLVASDSFSALGVARPNWGITSLEQLSENFSEHALIEAMHAMGLIGKAEKKALHGMLSKRNECAHPAEYYPTFNETLGYITEIFSRLRAIKKRYPLFSIV